MGALTRESIAIKLGRDSEGKRGILRDQIGGSALHRVCQCDKLLSKNEFYPELLGVQRDAPVAFQSSSLTFTALFLPIGSHLADYSHTHIFNPKWTPHAKFHTGQTLALSIVLGVLTLFFAWSETSDLRLTLIASASCASLYWVCQTLAILYPGTKYFDSDTKAVYLFGIPAQAGDVSQP